MGRDLKLERAWRERIRRFEQSGQTIQSFCQAEGLIGHQLTWWRRELKRRAGESASEKRDSKLVKQPHSVRSGKAVAAARFVPVELRQSPSQPSSVEIILDKPPRIAVSAGFDANLLHEVLRVLDQRDRSSSTPHARDSYACNKHRQDAAH